MELVFTRVLVSVTEAENQAIFEWCLDNAREFGAIPSDIILNMDEPTERTIEYNAMLSALTPAQLDEINQAILTHEAA